MCVRRRRASTIVAFGDSITDGTCTTLDAHDRWEDVVASASRCKTRSRRAVVNEGIGGNTVDQRDNYNPPINSPPGVDRLDRDVLSHPGVSHVVLFMGTNDITRGASAEPVDRGIKDIIARVHAKGIKIIGATIIPGTPQRGAGTGATATVRPRRSMPGSQGCGFRRCARFRPRGARPARSQPDRARPTIAATASIPRRSAISAWAERSI